MTPSMNSLDSFYYATVNMNVVIPTGLYLPGWDPRGTDNQTIVLHNVLRYVRQHMSDCDIQVQHIGISNIWEGPSLVKRS